MDEQDYTSIFVRMIVSVMNFSRQGVSNFDVQLFLKSTSTINLSYENVMSLLDYNELIYQTLPRFFSRATIVCYCSSPTNRQQRNAKEKNKQNARARQSTWKLLQFLEEPLLLLCACIFIQL